MHLTVEKVIVPAGAYTSADLRWCTIRFCSTGSPSKETWKRIRKCSKTKVRESFFRRPAAWPVQRWPFPYWSPLALLYLALYSQRQCRDAGLHRFRLIPGRYDASSYWCKYDRIHQAGQWQDRRSSRLLRKKRYWRQNDAIFFQRIEERESSVIRYKGVNYQEDLDHLIAQKKWVWRRWKWWGVSKSWNCISTSIMNFFSFTI